MNILPTLDSRWTLSNCTKAGLSFAFTGPGFAKVSLVDSDIKSLEPGRLSAIVFPMTLAQLADIKCVLKIRREATFSTYTSFLTSHTANLYSAWIEISKGTYDEATFEIIVTDSCAIQQVSLDIETQSYEEVINELKSELPKLLDDYNTYDIELTTEEVTVGLITANLLENTDLQGHFSVSLLASTKAEIVMRIYDDERKCLYSPSIISVNAGKHTIGFPHSYLKSKIGYHNFYVTLQATSGTVRIPTRDLLYTIDGAHMAERLLDAYSLVNDITAKITEASHEPVLLYTVGVLNDVATIRHIEPNQIGKANWVVDFVETEISAAAIEFDGEWHATAAGRMFITDELPTLFFVDINGVLWTQYFNLDNTAELASNVAKVCAVRGYRYHDQFTSNDMGLICAYIKTDGKVYYRHRIATEDNPILYWTTEAECIFDEATYPIKTININRTNDFRIAITVEDSEGVGFAKLTKRYYQATSVGTTLLEAAITLRINLAEPIYPTIVESWNIDNLGFFVEFSHDVFFANNLVSKLRFVDVNNVQYDIISMIQLDGNLLYFNVSNIGGYTEFIDLILDNSSDSIWAMNDGSRFMIPSGAYRINAEDFSLKRYSAEYINASVIMSLAFMEPEVHNRFTEVGIHASSTIDCNLVPVVYIDGYHTKDVGIYGAATIALTLVHVGTEPI